jgi:uncharacterized protein (TIGR03083 family)
VQTVASGPVADAFRAEAERLSEEISGVDEAGLGRPSPCPPWTVGELLSHVRIGVDRVPAMLAAPAPAPSPGPLISAPGYYRPDQRFSPATNRDRIAVAQQAAAALGTGSDLVRGFDQAWREAWSAVRRAPPGRVVLTRHGDRMLFTEFLRTRVLELAVHGLDLAGGLGRPPWLTEAAAVTVADLMLPADVVADLLTQAGWDQMTLIAKATGRAPVTSADAALFERHGLRRLSLG